MRQLIAVLTVLLLAARGAGAAPAPDQAVAARILPSLVKIIAVCGSHGQSRIGSGFVWGMDHAVVTDLHVVIGCRMPVTVLYFIRQGGGMVQSARSATVAHVLPTADLVLLAVRDPPPAPGLDLATIPVTPDQNVTAWGFPLGIEAPLDTRLRVSLTNDMFPQLKSTLDDRALAELARLHFPSLSTEVLHLAGPLEPGDSGAPVVNDRGRVVGIGSGGLRQGSASISWAVQAKYLDSLPRAGAAIPAAGDAPALFAYASPPAAVDTAHSDTGHADAGAAKATSAPASVLCGDAQLTFGGIRSLGQLEDAAGVDVPHKVLTTLGLTPERSDARFDLWVDLRSGATAITPAGVSLRPGRVACLAKLDRHVRMLIRREALPGDPTTPAWSLAVAAQRWQALGVYARQIHSGLRIVRDLPAWRTETVDNGALVRRMVLHGVRHQALVLRTDLAGRGASLAESVILEGRYTTAPPPAQQALVRGLAAVAFASFAPPDHTLAQTMIRVPGRAASPLSIPVASVFATIHCGAGFVLTGAVPHFAALARREPALPRIAAALHGLAGVSPDAIAHAQYNEWAEQPAGVAILVPRGMAPRPVTAKDVACRFTDPGDAGLRAALLRVGQPRGGAAIAALTGRLDDALGLHVTHLAPLDRGAGRRRNQFWQADARGDHRRWRVLVALQRSGQWSTLYAIASHGAPRSVLRFGAGIAGAMLAPAETRRLEAVLFHRN